MIKLHYIFIFHNVFHVRLDNRFGIKFCCVMVVRLVTSFTLTNHPSCTCVTFEKRDQAIVNYGYSRDVKEQRKYRVDFFDRVLWGVPDATLLNFNYVTLQGLFAVPEICLSFKNHSDSSITQHHVLTETCKINIQFLQKVYKNMPMSGNMHYYIYCSVLTFMSQFNQLMKGLN